MEEIFINIMERIAAEMPELSLIDEDYGQLESALGDDHYPVTFPCVLIGNTDANWSDLGGGAQNGAAFITVRLAIDCYTDTHYSSGTYQAVAERWKAANRLFCALQGFTPAGCASELTRIKQRDYAMPHNIKVFEFSFSFELHDESAMQML